MFKGDLKMQKIKRITFKYVEAEDKYVVLKIQNIKGFKPQQKLSQSDINELDTIDVEVIIK